MAGKIGEQKVRCSFCNKSEDQVRKLIAGPDGVYICDECIEICDEILEEELEDEFNMTVDEEINLLKPEEIKAFLDDYVIGQDEAKKALSVGTCKKSHVCSSLQSLQENPCRKRSGCRTAEK